MNNTILKIIAGVLALGAVVVALIGIKLSRQTAPAPTAQTASASAPAETVVVAARLIKAGRPLTPADVILKSVQAPPPTAYHQTQEMTGKIPLVDIQPGTALQPTQFNADTLSAQLRPGERAIAIQVDEVTSLSGQLRPGDHVDVVSYGNPDSDTGMVAYAQVTVPDVRILGMGLLTTSTKYKIGKGGLEAESTSSSSTTSGTESTSDSGIQIRNPPHPSTQEPKDVAELQTFVRDLRSAILAVPEEDVPRLMLAVHSGQLRLTLRPYADQIASPRDLAAAGKTGLLPLARPTMIRSELAPSAVGLAGRFARKNSSRIVIQEGSTERKLPAEEQD